MGWLRGVFGGPPSPQGVWGSLGVSCVFWACCGSPSGFWGRRLGIINLGGTAGSHPWGGSGEAVGVPLIFWEVLGCLPNLGRSCRSPSGLLGGLQGPLRSFGEAVGSVLHLLGIVWGVLWGSCCPWGWEGIAFGRGLPVQRALTGVLGRGCSVPSPVPQFPHG